MNWLRLYKEFATDPKVQIMSEALQRRFIMLLCLSNGNGHVTLHVTEIAFALRISEEELAQTKALFIEKGFISEDWKLLNWDKRQYRSDSSLERVRRYRNVKKKEVVTKCNVTVTLPDTEQIQNRTDTEEVDSLRSSSKQSEVSKMCLDILPDEWRRWTIQERGWDEILIADTWKAFRNHYQKEKGKNAKRADWFKSWKCWCRKENIKPKGSTYGKPTTQRFAEQDYRAGTEGFIVD